MTNIMAKILTLCLLVSPVLHAVGPMPERRMTKDEVKQTAQQIIWELTTPESTPLTVADTIVANDAALAQAAQTARQQAAERSKREEKERADYQASLIKVADIADANVEAELVATPAKQADAQEIATTVSDDVDFDVDAQEQYPEQQVQEYNKHEVIVTHDDEEQEELRKQHAAQQTAAQPASTVVIAEEAHAPVTATFVPAQVNVPALPVATEFIPARPETPEDTRAYDKVQMREIWHAHEVHEVNQQDVRAVIAAERAKNRQAQQQAHTADVSQAIQVPAIQDQDTAATQSPQNLGTWCDYIREYQAAWERDHTTSLTTKAAGLGLGLLVAYLAYKGLKWVYDTYKPGPSKIKGPKQAKNHGRPAGKRYPKNLKKV